MGLPSVAEISCSRTLPVGVADDEARVRFLGGPGWREAARRRARRLAERKETAKRGHEIVSHRFLGKCVRLDAFVYLGAGLIQ